MLCKSKPRANDCADPNLEQSCGAVNVSECFDAVFLKEKKKSVTPCIKCTDIKDSATSKQVRHKLLACTVELRGFKTGMQLLKCNLYG